MCFPRLLKSICMLLWWSLCRLNTGELEEEIDDENYQSCDDKTPRQDCDDKTPRQEDVVDRFPVTTHEYKLAAKLRGWFSYRRLSLSPERKSELESFSRS